MRQTNISSKIISIHRKPDTDFYVMKKPRPMLQEKFIAKVFPNWELCLIFDKTFF